MSADPLVQHAVDRVWCSPEQDYQAIYKIHRLTSPMGARRFWSSLMVEIDLPDNTNHYHLFTFGQLVPELAALFPCDTVYPEENVWTSLLESANTYNTVVDIYFENGVKVPLSECYFIITDEKALVLAVKELSVVGCVDQRSISSVRFGQDALYARIYKNAYFSSGNTLPDDKVFYACAQPKTNTELIQFQGVYEQYVSKRGLVSAWRNGFLVSKIALTTCQAGDWLEFVYDSSVKGVFDFPLPSLPVFLSSMDGKEKYLLHCEKPLDITDNKIEYHDDVDLFLWRDDKTYVNGVVNNQVVNYCPGVYLHKNTPNTLRMVTHRDYSLPVSLVAVYLNKHQSTVLQPNTGNDNRLYLRMVVRKSGYDRPLVNDANRIKELYKLPDTNIIQAMVGVNSLVPGWKAANLESSNYCKLMGWPMSEQLTPEVVTNAYGYDSVVNLFAKPVLKTRVWSGQLLVDCPVLYEKDSTGFEFDQQGELLGYYYHDAGVYYNCRNAGARYVEFVRGKIDGFVDEYIDQTTSLLDLGKEWGFYISPKATNPQTTSWQCVTGDATKYTINPTTGLLTWLVSATHHTVARSNAKAVVIEKGFDLGDGLMGFNISPNRIVNGVVTEVPTPIAFGEVDVWINGKYAIKDLDYRVSWPHLCVVNKSYLTNGGVQKITVRLKGLCASDFSFVDEKEYGFVVNGRLSADRHYDLREDKACLFFLGGGVKTNDEVLFVEQNPTFEILNALNGKPYVVKDAVVGMKDYTGLYTADLRAKSVGIDKAVGNYLTVNGFGLEIPASVNPISSLHRVYSPFLSNIISDIKRGYLNPSYWSGQYSSNEIFTTLQPYEYLLAYDPIHDNNTPEKDFVIIDPHCWFSPIDLTLYQYLFVKRVISLYAGDKVSFANHLRVTN